MNQCGVRATHQPTPRPLDKERIPLLALLPAGTGIWRPESTPHRYQVLFVRQMHKSPKVPGVAIRLLSIAKFVFLRTPRPGARLVGSKQQVQGRDHISGADNTWTTKTTVNARHTMTPQQKYHCKRRCHIECMGHRNINSRKRSSFNQPSGLNTTILHPNNQAAKQKQSGNITCGCWGHGETKHARL